MGFRPFIYRIARENRLSGFVLNRGDGIRIEAEGNADQLEAFISLISSSHPPQSTINSLTIEDLPPLKDRSEFLIHSSDSNALVRPSIPADLGTCLECQTEIFDSKEYRFGYPFTNCTHCGPRYSIINNLPYDRARTSMQGFALCPHCQKEYQNPLDRRFHAQPIACPQCGPSLQLIEPDGTILAKNQQALLKAVSALRVSNIIALKGLGGFQLLVVATCEKAVKQLRTRKNREAKPFAVLFPSLDAVRECCITNAQEESALISTQSPIVLIRKRLSAPLAPSVSPANPQLGAMLPYTPLHHLLMKELAQPVVCTSGNISQEPMCIDNSEALERLGTIADLFLVHDRPIVRPVDDSIIKVGPKGWELQRRARGFAPLPLPFPYSGPSILALGGQQKNTVALTLEKQIVISQHLGDLESAQGAALLKKTVIDITSFYQVSPQIIACDLHPDYTSTQLGFQLAQEYKASLIQIPHHQAHVAAVMAEHQLTGNVLGLAWDGTGLGPDNTIWGGEFLVCQQGEYQRAATLRPFPLPGGEAAIREPRRSALGLLHSIWEPSFFDWAQKQFSSSELPALLQILNHQICAPLTSSMGRLFDAVSALIGIRQKNQFEGQAAMELEFAAEDMDTTDTYTMLVTKSIKLTKHLPGHCLENTKTIPIIIDWEPMIREIIQDSADNFPAAVISAKFHNWLAKLSCEIAKQVNIPQIVLSGGCFQNTRLTRMVSRKLEEAGFAVYWGQAIPTNDGAISLGQAFVASQKI